MGGGNWIYLTPGVGVLVGKGVNVQGEVKLPLYRLMRTLAAMMVLITTLAFSSRAQEAVEKRTTLKVSGMSCGECAKTVEKEAQKIEGVKAVTVDRSKGEAEITYDPAKTSPEAIAKTINQKTGFKAEVPKDPQKKQP